MTIHIKGTKHRHKVRFTTRAMATSSSQADPSATSRLEDPSTATASPPQPPSGSIIEELSSDSDQSPSSPWADDPDPDPTPIPIRTRNPVTMSTSAASIIPSLFTTWPPIRDALTTQTSELQDETTATILPYLSSRAPDSPHPPNHAGIPHLNRQRHIAFLHKTLGDLPAPYVAGDAGRPWFFYWAICGLAALGADVTVYRDRLVSTVRPMQNVSGGFAGGHGQYSHLAPTYAIMLALAEVGGEEALGVVDRKAMWEWLGEVKQVDGGFQMSVGGEEDVRGAYCAATLISLLDLPLDLPLDSPARKGGLTSLLEGTPEYITRCQTFEGGISGRPDAEAHGAYAFCALACLCILGDPSVIIPKYLDLPALASWLSSRQYAPEGGFAGRTNKLVDGCYSHWVGASWPLVAAAFKNNKALYSREALIRYILCACQDTSNRGGLRDKPGKMSDGYHTCYVLSGLSSAQHLWTYDPNMTVPSASGVPAALDSAYKWEVSNAVPGEQLFDEQDRVGKLHPVFVVSEGVAERTRAWFESRGGF